MSFKILHTADWHVGKIFYERSLLPDQDFFINQIICELQNEKDKGEDYDALIIAGDIYDTANPAADAMNLLDKFYVTVNKKFPDLNLIILKGNHDSIRIGLNKNFLNMHNIHICSDTENFFEPILVLKKESEEICFYTLPYLNQQTKFSFENSETKNSSSSGKLMTQSELVETACKKISETHKKNHPDSLSVLCAHLTTFGSLKSNYDENAVGAIEEVSSDFFLPFNYTALGHIHKFQKCGKSETVYYSGSPLSYYFDSTTENYMIRANIEKNKKPEITQIAFNPLHKVERLNGFINDFLNADNKFISEHKNNYIEFIYKDEVPPLNSIQKLKALYPLALSFKQEEQKIEGNKNNTSLEMREQTFDEPEKYFDAFYKDVFGQEIKDEKLHKDAKELFIKIAKKVENNFDIEQQENGDE